MIQQLTPPISGADQLAEVRRLYGQGLYLRAFAKAEAMAPLRDWTGPERRIMAGRLAGVLGGGRLARALHLVALRESPADPTVCYFGVRAVMSRWGPWFARRLWNRIGPLPEAPRNLRADWLAHYALISATLRDFEVADHFLAEALALAPQRAWIHVEHSAVLQIEDRFDEALAAAERALAIRPWYRPGVQTVAHYLCGQGRDREALELLSAADERLECGDIVAQRVALERELGLSADARRSLARLAELYPLQDKQVARWIAAVECDLASECDDLPGAIAAGRRAGRGFYERVVANLEAAVTLDKRVVLPVEFVQQHHLTCAPATLAALCKFWGHDAGQLEITEQICYDGTPHHRQRAWTEANGFTTREFAVDWDSARALVDRGVPFTMTTIQPPTSHLIAVIGYDARRQTLVLRDPSLRYRTEMLAKEGLESLRSTGPVGMVMVPHEQAHRLDGVTLQDAELYDELYELQMALERHDRDRAAAVLDRMRALDPEHRLTLYARRALAAYDCDPSAAGHSYEQMLKQFPDDTMLLLARIESIRGDTTRQERIDYLTELVGTRSEPLFRLHLAEELSVDTRCHGEASQLLRRLLVQRPYEARCYYARARIMWESGRFGEATELYRCAACLSDKDDRFARDWFLAARHVKQGEQALGFLRARFDRYGDQSSRPAVSLSHAYNLLGLGQEALRVLDAAIQRRPADGDLLLFAADSFRSRGDFARAKGLLVEAEGHSRHGSWLRSAAALATAEGELAQARDRWTEVIALEPQAADAHRELCWLLAATVGDETSLDHLRQTIARFPNNLALLRLAVERLGPEHPEEAEAMLRRLLDANPVDAWAHRELATLTVREGRPSEALVEAETAIALSPNESIGYGVRGWIHERSGDISLAMADYRLAIEHSADDEQAIARLIFCAANHAERAAALEFIHEQLKRQTMFGTGILAYRDQARGVIKPDEILAHLREALEARPDLWHAWSAVIRQLAEMGSLAEAATLAIAATERFPLLPAAWCDLATVRRAGGEFAAEIAALEKALEINPNWDVPIRALAEALNRTGRLDRQRSLLEDAVARMPLGGVLRGCLADVLWHTGDRPAALDALEQAGRNLPDYDWAWNALEERSRQMGCPERAEQAARDLVTRRPGDARSWLRLARILHSSESLDERMAALDRAIQLTPRSTNAHLLRAETLRLAKRYAEARQACTPPNFGGRPPAELRLEAARISVAEGRPEIALAETRAIVEENPDFYDGWRQICEWDINVPANRTEFLEAAKRLVALRPDDAHGWRYLADARLAHEDRGEAINAFRRAIALQPSWTYVRHRLFDLYFHDKQHEPVAGSLCGALGDCIVSSVDAAAEVLEVPLERDRDAYTLARHIQLLGARNDRAAVVAAFTELCSLQQPTEWPLVTAIGIMLGNFLRDEARIALRAAMDQPGTDRQVFLQWANLEIKAKQWRRAVKELETLTGNEAAWATATGALLKEIVPALLNDKAQANERPHVRRFIRRNALRLKRDVVAWGYAGLALLTIREPRQAVKWLADWKQRQGVRPWMLNNLAVSLTLLHRYKEAAAVHRHALTLPPDNTFAFHRVDLAALEAAAGEFDAAQTLLDGTDARQLNDPRRCLRAAVEEALRLRADSALARQWCPSLEANRRFRQALAPFKKQLHSNRFLRTSSSRVAEGLARDRGWWLLWLLS